MAGIREALRLAQSGECDVVVRLTDDDTLVGSVFAVGDDYLVVWDEVRFIVPFDSVVWVALKDDVIDALEETGLDRG